MDSTDKPTVSLTFDDVGLTPTYLKTTIEDLANDQIQMEQAIAANRTMAFIALSAGLMGVALGVLSVKMAKLVVNNMGQLGEALYATQQHVGMVPVPPAPIVVEESPSEEKLRVNRDHGQQIQQEAVVIGDGYDPGPQDVPEDVRAAVESEPVSDWLDEDL